MFCEVRYWSARLYCVYGRVSIIPSKKIPAEIFFGGIHDTEYGIPAEFLKNSVSTEYGIPQYGNPYSAEFRKNTEFRNIRNSVYTEFRIHTEFHKNYGIP